MEKWILEFAKALGEELNKHIDENTLRVRVRIGESVLEYVRDLKGASIAKVHNVDVSEHFTQLLRIYKEGEKE